MAQLTATQIKNSKPQSKQYSLSDGEGLSLVIKPNGSKLWLFRYTRPIVQKRANLSLGAYPDLSLLDARKLRLNARELLAKGVDPKADKDAKNRREKARLLHTFESITLEWLKLKDVKPKTLQGIANALHNHLLPHIGKMPIADVTALQVIEVLRPIEEVGKIEMVGRICQYTNGIMTYALNHGIVSNNPLSGIKAVFKNKAVTHNPHVEVTELPQLMRTIAEADIRRKTKLMIQFQLHTMTRPAETAQIEWSDIDNDVWTIPLEKSKTKQMHKIPLSVQSLEILNQMKVFSRGSNYVFCNAKDNGQPANSQSANTALKRMGYKGKQTAHGLRGLARTTLSEQGFNHDVAECCLGHKIGNAVSQSYNHSTYFNQRVEVMRWWSEHIAEAIEGRFKITHTKTLKAV
jgi:integrase